MLGQEETITSLAKANGVRYFKQSDMFC